MAWELQETIPVFGAILIDHLGFQFGDEMLRYEWYFDYTYLKSHRDKCYLPPHDRPIPESRERSGDWEEDPGRSCM